MSKLETFRAELLADIKSEAEANTQYPALQFLETVSAELSLYDKCPVAVPCFYERSGRKNRKLLIHGYHLDDFDWSMSLFICDYKGTPELTTITKTDFSNYVKQVTAFIEDSLDGHVEEISECADEGFGLAQDIRRNRENINRYFIYVISDRKRSDQFTMFEEKDIDGKKLLCRIIDIEFYYDSVLEQTPPDNIVIRVPEMSGLSGIHCMSASCGITEYQSYLCVVPGTFLATAYREYGLKLLESNVRNYLGLGGEANKGIRNTIQNDPQLFFAYNNGITTTATGIKIDEGGIITEFENLQIVNGGQTTVSIYNEWRKDKTSVDAVYVPMKLTVSSPEIARTIVPSISKYANMQNTVKKSDLDSNSDFQKQMEYFSRNTRLPQSNEAVGSRKWYYERTRNQFAQDPGNINDTYNFKRQYDKKRKVDKLDFAKFRCIISLKPFIVAKGREACYKDHSNAIADRWEKNKDEFNIDYYKETIAMIILYNGVYSEIPKREWFAERSSIKAPLTYYSISKLLYELSKRDVKLNLIKIWNEQNISDVIVRQIASIAKTFVEYLDNEILSTGKLFTQWFKQEACWDDVKKLSIEFDSSILSECISERDYVVRRSTAETIEKEARNSQERNNILIKAPAFWKSLQYWMEKNMRSLTIMEKTTLQKVINGGKPTDIQIKKLQELMMEAKERGFNHPDLA